MLPLNNFVACEVGDIGHTGLTARFEDHPTYYVQSDYAYRSSGAMIRLTDVRPEETKVGVVGV